MIELLAKYSLSEIAAFLITFALAIKGVISFYDWATERLKKAFSKETQRDKEKEVLEERLVYGADKMRALDKQQKQTNEQLKAIHKQLEMLISSDKDDIKADLTKDHHYFCYKKKWIDDYSLDCMQRRFERYVEEGGNSFIEKLMDEVKDLPNQPPSDLDN